MQVTLQSSSICSLENSLNQDEIEESSQARSSTSSTATSTERTDAGSDDSLFGISQPHGHDVLCGRGVTTNRHKGNEKFRDFVDEKKDEYVKSTKREKNKISKSIVQHVRNLDPPGRFLEKNVNGLWYDIGDKKACEKTAQALRDRAAKMKTKGKSKLPAIQTSISFDPAMPTYDRHAAFIRNAYKEPQLPHNCYNIPRHRRSNSTPVVPFDAGSAYNNNTIIYEPLKDHVVKSHRRVCSNPEIDIEGLNTLPEIEPLPFETEHPDFDLPSNPEFFNSIFATDSPNSSPLRNNHFHSRSGRNPRPNHRKRPSGDFNDPSFILATDVLSNSQPLGVDSQHKVFPDQSPISSDHRSLPTPRKKVCAITPQPTTSSFTYQYGNDNSSPTIPNLECAQFSLMANDKGEARNDGNDSFSSTKSNGSPDYSRNLYHQNQSPQQQLSLNYEFPSTNNNINENNVLTNNSNIAKDYSNHEYIDPSHFSLK